VRLGTRLLKNTNRKPYSIYLMVQLSMTLSDLWPGFQGHDSFGSQISLKRCALGTKLVQNTNRTLIHSLLNGTTFNDPERPLKPISMSRHCSTLNILETTRDRASYYRTSIVSRMRFIAWWHFQWPWRTRNPVVKVTSFLKPIILKVHLRDKVSIEH